MSIVFSEDAKASIASSELLSLKLVGNPYFSAVLQPRCMNYRLNMGWISPSEQKKGITWKEQQQSLSLKA